MGGQTISIIIPTLATSERAPFLRRALESALAQEQVRAVPIVVANGPSVAPDLARWLEGRTDIRFEYREEANLPQGLASGRDLVDTPFFSELDDDDILMPHALISRLKRMDDDEAVDAVISNGFIEKEGGRVISRSHFSECHNDPLRRILDGHWLHPGAGLFRTSAMSRDFFASMPQYLEWTYLALRLALERRIAFIDNPSFVHYTDHPFGIWRSRAATLGLPRALEQILSLDLPTDVRLVYEGHLSEACQMVSKLRLEEKDVPSAWEWQVKSLRHGFDRKSLPYMASLLMRLVASRWLY
ncbi:MAG TPA: glycosyltransferase family A protein [Candidatus Bathyarchaeia archaeon]|nr:glycosyltransferase family A protein [Candidatus Bathyarchaeia archaeon]